MLINQVDLDMLFPIVNGNFRIMENQKYFHDEQAHNLTDPSVIVPIIMDVIKPKSVIDVGCGIGTFLHVFKQNGISDYLGVDGDWVDKEMLSRYIELDKFKVTDLENGVDIDRKFDLVICLEVVEHLKEDSADKIVKDLTSLSDVILFSAAIPGQGGQNHINEQWLEYWLEKFKKHGYSFHDVIRPILWNNKDVARWYKQNMFLVVIDGKERITEGFEKYFDTKIHNYIHPEYFEIRVRELESMTNRNSILNEKLDRLNSGRDSFYYYLKLMLKKILRVLKIHKNK